MREDNEMKKFRAASVTTLGVGLLLSLGAALGVRAAQSQALPTATAPGAYIAIGGSYAYFKPQYPQASLGGAGVYVDIQARRWLGIEAEGRWLREGQISGSHQTTYLIGPRIELRRGRFSPYVKGLVGDGRLVFPYGFGYGDYLVVAPGGGLDVNLTRNIKLRVIDFEYQYWPQFTLGAISPYGFSAGVSYKVFNPGGWHHRRYR